MRGEKRKAKELLTRVEEKYGKDDDHIEKLIFQLNNCGELVIREINYEENGEFEQIIQENGKIEENLVEERIVNNVDIEISQINAGLDQRNGEYEKISDLTEREVENVGIEGQSSVSLQDEDILDTNSSVFDRSNWPGDAHIRCHSYYKNWNPPSSIRRSESLIVYLSLNSYRIEGNPSFSMALWFSKSLQIDLGVVVRPSSSSL